MPDVPEVMCCIALYAEAVEGVYCVLEVVENMLGFLELPGGNALCVGGRGDMLCVLKVVEDMLYMLEAVKGVLYAGGRGKWSASWSSWR